MTVLSSVSQHPPPPPLVSLPSPSIMLCMPLSFSPSLSISLLPLLTRQVPTWTPGAKFVGWQRRCNRVLQDICCPLIKGACGVHIRTCHVCCGSKRTTRIWNCIMVLKHPCHHQQASKINYADSSIGARSPVPQTSKKTIFQTREKLTSLAGGRSLLHKPEDHYVMCKDCRV